ncbi:MAG: aminotransferase class V-fold PLP-dependent enzyme [Clostridia bacterium]|nr:aminotransferase class V-fold PLP-dependent enzyme [Clostridia bacterium]
MLNFSSDYTNGAHPDVLRHLVATNDEVLTTYGSDLYTASAAEKIRRTCGAPAAEIYFLSGGTQTNLTVIAGLLGACAGVIAADTGHIALHEAGAIEYTGHKVLTLPHSQGKLTAEAVEATIGAFYADSNYPHMPYPGMVYLSHPTEYGTLYSKAELEAIAAVCRCYAIPLFLDGARLGYGLASRETDLTLQDIAELCDVFYIGGTKVGALCGEAVVFPRGNSPRHFFTIIKQHGALLAKGRLVGVQFDALFTDDLYLRISRHAIDIAEKLKVILHEKGYRFFMETPTNQQFVILENAHYTALAKKVAVSYWEPYDAHHTVVRFATSWSTTEADLDALRGLL